MYVNELLCVPFLLELCIVIIICEQQERNKGNKKKLGKTTSNGGRKHDGAIFGFYCVQPAFL